MKPVVGSVSQIRRLVSRDKLPPLPVSQRSFASCAPLSSSRHCDTCTCPTPTACGAPRESDHELPPPLPEPNFTFRRRLIPRERMTPLHSTLGTQRLVQALQQGTAASYIPLTEQFVNQSDPAFCGVTTLMMVLNTLAMDPNVRWRGGWRFYGDEQVLLQQCCFNEERIRRIGIHMEEFQRMAHCQGLISQMFRAGTGDDPSYASLDDFRKHLLEILTYQDNEQTDNGVIVVSFSRQALDQTGDGHFSPIAAYHQDQVLILDVARFKYQPYWVSVNDLYQSMQLPDKATQKSRGWFVLRPPVRSSHYTGTRILDEGRRSVDRVPAVGEGDACPVQSVKVEYCSMHKKDR